MNFSKQASSTQPPVSEDFRAQDAIGPAEPFHPESVFWVNKSPWQKPGPIVSMGVRNATAFASLGLPTQLFLSAQAPLPKKQQIEHQLKEFYGLAQVPPSLEIRLCEDHRSLHPLRRVYREALRSLRNELGQGKKVLALTREEGFLPALLRLRKSRLGQNLRIIHESHDFFLSLEHLEHIRWDDRRRQQLGRRLFPYLDGLLCLTQEQQKLYQQFFEQAQVTLPLLNLPLGTETLSVEDPQTLCARRTLVYVGHLHQSKGQQTLLDSARALSKAGIHLHLYGGSPEQAGKLQERLDKRMNKGGHALVRPFLPPQEMHALLAREASASLVLLQDSFYNRNLTCPVKALDSLSHGLPTLASDLPSTRQVLQDAALYLPPGDPQAFAQQAQELFNDQENFAQLAQTAQQRQQELLWPKRAERILRWLGRKMV